MRTSLAAPVAFLLLAATAAAAASGGGLCDALARGDAGTARLAVVSAFPAELAAVVAGATVEETVSVDGRSYYLATIGGVRVVLGLTGIGMVNATSRAESVLGHFPIVGVVMSGVAGSTHRIADVVVPTRWIVGADGSTFRTNVALRALARRATRGLTLERCTLPTTGPVVCLPHQPRVFFGGRGRSMDPFKGSATSCIPGAGDIFGCELPVPAAAAAETFTIEDMETAAVMGAAAHHHLPGIAFRAVSDGPGDPLNLPGFPTQFFTYYKVAARNAGAGTLAFLRRLGELGLRAPGNRRTCALLARRRWRQAARRLAR
jgi:adenosylhomocysteine nucleosidase